MLGPAIVYIIENTAAITAIIATRLRPIADDAEGTPAVYYIVEGRPYYNKNGQQMQDWKAILYTNHRNYGDAWQLSMLIKEAFDNYRRKVVGDTGITFTECQCTLLRDDYEFLIEGYGQKIEFEIKTQTLKAV